MKQYKVLVTEMHTAEYHVKADSRDKAITEVLTGINEPVSSCYNETLKDPDDMYVVEMKED